MSSPKESLSKTSKSPIASVTSIKDVEDETSATPDFIYGGPFINVEKPDPFINTSTPINLCLQGTFKNFSSFDYALTNQSIRTSVYNPRLSIEEEEVIITLQESFAYYSLKERLPIILTKVIDYLSRSTSKIKSAHGAKDEDMKNLIHYISKLKNDLMTNKKYDVLNVDTPEAKKWNEWILAAEDSHYFTNTWVFTECYVYRRLREGCELTKSLKNFDPFDAQKEEALVSSMEMMCLVADKLTTMLPESDKDKRKVDFITLLKLCLWGNMCDLSLSSGEQVSMKQKSAEASNTPASDPKAKGANSPTGQCHAVLDPFQMIIDLKDKVLVDDSAKIVDQVLAKADNMRKAIEGPPPSAPGSAKGSPTSTPAEPAEGVELPKIPCPAKMTIPQSVMFDIVCDNAGYELFTDLCLAHFLISQGIVQKVRFHVKSIPWFVSDVTPRDFKYMIDSCSRANYNKTLPAEPKSEAAEGETAETSPPRIINADSLRPLGEAWAKYVQDGTFVVMSDDFWTSPHVFKDMKKYDSDLYRKLQFACAVLFKGDLNYRKLLGEKNWNPTTGFEAALQGFNPAPLLALRTVKADLICGLPKGKFEQLTRVDEKWMEKGEYGVIQFCPKAEPLKPAEGPCADYGDACRGVACPRRADL